MKSPAKAPAKIPTKTPAKTTAQRDARYFASPDKFRAWLKANHAKQLEQWVGFYKHESKMPSITWPESVNEALCFGWIDGLRQNVDAVSYRIRFTPRKPTSNWSVINIRRVAVLTAEGRMQEAGNKAFAERKMERTRVYAYENSDMALPPEYERRLQKNKAAKKYFDSQSPSYRKGARRWVLSAKQEATRDARLATLIACSAAQDFIPPFRWSVSAPSRKTTGTQKKK